MKNLIITVITVIVIGLIYFAYAANKDKFSSIAPPAGSQTDTATLPSPSQETAPEPVAAPQVTDETGPFVSSPLKGDSVGSPLTVTGIVPPGWMFEGSFGVKLFTDSDVLVTQTAAEEKIPGSWQSGEPIEFTARLTYTTDAESGYILLEKANPSGLTENEGFHKLPILFSD